jgi:hypothetical protein
MSISALLCQRQTFWRLKMWLWFCSLLTVVAWSVILFLVSDHESGATGAMSIMFLTFMNSKWASYMRPQKVSYSSVSRFGRKFGSTALFRRGPIWRW